MEFELCKLTDCDIDTSYKLIVSVTGAMQRAGINQWDSIYPDKAIIEYDIKSGNAYGYYYGSLLCGYIALNDEYPSEYDTIPWKYNGKILSVHRVAVMEEHQRKGIGTILMNFAISYAKENHYDTIRLDAYAANLSSNTLYNKMGFRKAGEILFRTGLFNCYEVSLHM